MQDLHHDRPIGSILVMNDLIATTVTDFKRSYRTANFGDKDEVRGKIGQQI